MIAQSFEITAHTSANKLLDREFSSWFCSLVVSCLTCDHKVGGSIPCQEKSYILIRYKIVLFPPFIQAIIVKKFKSEAEFIINKLHLLCSDKFRR